MIREKKMTYAQVKEDVKLLWNHYKPAALAYFFVGAAVGGFFAKVL